MFFFVHWTTSSRADFEYIDKSGSNLVWLTHFIIGHSSSFGWNYSILLYGTKTKFLLEHTNKYCVWVMFFFVFRIIKKSFITFFFVISLGLEKLIFSSLTTPICLFLFFFFCENRFYLFPFFVYFDLFYFIQRNRKK